MSLSKSAPTRPLKILVGLTGSIACFKTAALISQMKKAGHEIQTIATSAALEFVGEATLEGLSGKPVQTGTFTRGQMMDHIHLARWADVFIVAPLTALHANKFALGLADDLLTTLYMAYEPKKPLFLAPAMNHVMYSHPTVQESLKVLKARGAVVIEASSGDLACGETGMGRMAEPEEILKTVLSNVGQSPAPAASPATPHFHRGPILVTFGGTREAIDGVRSITNFSTGRTGAELVDILASRGFAVTALCAEGAIQPRQAQHTFHFQSHGDLEQKLKSLLQNQSFTAVLHLAAVSDYSVEKIVAGNKEILPSADLKISSDHDRMALVLKKNSKIVNSIRSHSRNPLVGVAAFKLTHTRNLPERLNSVATLLQNSGADWVIHNDLAEIEKSSDRHPFNIYSRAGLQAEVQNVRELAAEIENLLASHATAAPKRRDPEVSHDSLS
jgi:phosphopantothenoylcysteine decarboxylase/phosphopantothenate--cysteine ligase